VKLGSSYSALKKYSEAEEAYKKATSIEESRGID
jgi:hypothetical protein